MSTVSKSTAKSAPRSPRSRSRSVSRSPAQAARAQAQDRLMWIYLLIAVVVFVVIYFVVAGNMHGVHQWGRVNDMLSNPLLLSLIVIIVAVLAAFATYTGHREHARLGRTPWVVTLGTLFVVIGLLLVLLAYLVYRAHSYTLAFYVALLVFVLSLVHLYGVWVVHPMVSAAVLPLVFFSLVLVYYTWYFSDEDAKQSHHVKVTVAPPLL